MIVTIPLLLLAGCGRSEDDVINGVRLPDIEVAGWSLGVTHPHMHLVTANHWEYEAITAAGVEHTSAVVPEERRPFLEVEATALKSTVTLDGAPLRERTDWLAMDNVGNVWRVGEEECEYKGGSCVDTGRSWAWTGGDARPGIVLPGGPEPGTRPFYETYYQGKIEDVAEVLDVEQPLDVPGGPFSDCIVIRETSKLDESVDRTIYYCRIVGAALVQDGDVKTELLSFGGV